MEAHSLVKGEHIVQKLQKLNRYFISNEGVKLVKHNPDGRNIKIESDSRWKQTLCNYLSDTHIKNFESFDIDIDYYLINIYKEINAIDTNVSRGYIQQTLF